MSDYKVLGSIELDAEDAFGCSVDAPPVDRNENGYFENLVAVRSIDDAFDFRSCDNAQCVNCMTLGAGDNGIRAYQGEITALSFGCVNCLAVDGALAGITIEDQDSWEIRSSNSFGNQTNLSTPSPGGQTVNFSEVDPELGSCLVYVPESSPMKGAGESGADIGANVVYRYIDGVLTHVPLWDPATGAFPCGAVIPGVNDNPATSCMGVHERLNVGVNGCPLPY